MVCCYSETDESTEVQPTLFDILEAEESKRLMSLPPNNAFDEMIRWTEEGKLWTFPIDNEQGCSASGVLVCPKPFVVVSLLSYTLI